MNPPPRVHFFGGTTDTVGHIKTFASWRAFREYLVNAGPFNSKTDCPMFSAGIFDGPIKGRVPTEFTVVVGEHDAGEVGVDEGINRLKKVGIAALIYTSASHTPERPRWRVVAPLQRLCCTEDYLAYLNLLNGALGGCLAPESADLNRRWFFGRVEGAPYEWKAAKGREPIDEVAAGEHDIALVEVKPKKADRVAREPLAATSEPLTEQQVADIRSALAVLDANSRDAWIGVIQNSKRHSELYEPVREWSAQSPTHTDEEFDIKWNEPGGERSDYRSIFTKAQARGWKNPVIERARHDAFRQTGPEGLPNPGVLPAAPVDVEAVANRLGGLCLACDTLDDGVDARLAADIRQMADEERTQTVTIIGEKISPEAAAETRALFERLAKGQDLTVELTRNSRGKIEATYTNVYAACARPEVVGLTLGYDEFLDEIVISVDAGECWSAMTDADYVEIQRRLERSGFSRVAKEVLRDVVGAVAYGARRFDTAKLWLGRLKWDGTPRVERFMSTHLGAEDTPYTRAVARYQWTAMAGRVLDPGCQADMVPVWVGPQGAKKSSIARAQVPDARFFKELSFGERDADLSRKMRGLLIGELGELRGLATRELEAVKAWITQRDEHWTPKFKEFGTTFARRCIFIGTTNQQNFLADETGERRWLPVTVGACDPDAVSRDLEQLWAEAREMYLRDGVAWRDAERLAQAEHDQYKVHDAWADTIHRWLDEEPPTLSGEAQEPGRRRDRPFTTGDVMREALQIDTAHQRPAEQQRVARILRAAGFKCDKTQSRVAGDRVRYWRATE